MTIGIFDRPHNQSRRWTASWLASQHNRAISFSARLQSLAQEKRMLPQGSKSNHMPIWNMTSGQWWIDFSSFTLSDVTLPHSSDERSGPAIGLALW